MKTNSKFESIKTIFWAILIALIIRSFVFEPFNIPSGSMKPTLLVGDFIFVKKWSYGYSKHSLPFSINIIPERILYKKPSRGDIAVFKTPKDNRTDYIKRIIGLPGDKIKLNNGVVFINNKPITKIQVDDFFEKNDNNELTLIPMFKENLGNVKHYTLDIGQTSLDNVQTIEVPENHFFVLGDNRDNSADSRISKLIGGPGFIPKENLVGKASIIFFSLENSRFYQIWKWPTSIRYSRIFSKIK